MSVMRIWGSSVEGDERLMRLWRVWRPRDDFWWMRMRAFSREAVTVLLRNLMAWKRTYLLGFHLGR